MEYGAIFKWFPLWLIFRDVQSTQELPEQQELMDFYSAVDKLKKRL